jgi:hypothetical protein
MTLETFALITPNENICATAKNTEMTNLWFSAFEDLIWGDVFAKSRGRAAVMNMTVGAEDMVPEAGREIGFSYH